MSEVEIVLPDGARRRIARGASGAQLAADISPSLAKKAAVMRMDGALCDLGAPLNADCAVEFLSRDDDEALPLIRHDCAHLLAQAAQQLYPDAQPTIGPAIKDGFYYDFHRETPFTPEDLAALEARMRELAAQKIAVRREEWTREEARAYYQQRGEKFKVELVDAIPANETVSFYRQGDFVDLCRGPHMPHTGFAGSAFKLTAVAGAYWRGDSQGAQLQRIYGTAWRNDKELRAHLQFLEEAARRDHRRLGREMGLFHLQEEAAGMVFWHDPGWRLYLELEGYMRRRLRAAGYEEVKTPQLVERRLWEQSGHWEKFRENMYLAENEDGVQAFAAAPQERRVFALKPMNCPCHVQIYRQGVKSYRDLPLRMAEFGSCHRFEPSGALHGLLRVRHFVQDDAHIFCTEAQVRDETVAFCELLRAVYADLGFDEVRVNFADRPAKRAGSDEVWTNAEKALREGCEAANLHTTLNPGEGAFYGPKLEFVLRDAIGREWQCGTLQADFVLPSSLGAEYAEADGARRAPVMLHRAILGSFERFIGVLLEHTAGHLPLWLSPLQARVATITDAANDYAQKAVDAFAAAGLRAGADCRNEKISYKIREHSAAKAPVIAVVGEKEARENTVALRRLGGARQEILPLAEAVKKLAAEAKPPF